jgi:hypothetical protein
MRFARSFWLLGAIVGSIACSGSTDVFTGPASIDGKWVEGSSVPGSVLLMDLTAAGSIVSGSGNYCGEAGPCGTVSVAGTVGGIAVHLDLTLTQQVPQVGTATIEHFDGTFTSANTIKGTITTDTPGQVIGHTSYSRVS